MHETALEAALRRGQPWLPRQVVLQGKWAVRDEMRCSNESSARYGGSSEWTARVEAEHRAI